MASKLVAIVEAYRTAERYLGCGDHSCLFKRPAGMATNGGCLCVDRGGGRPGVQPALGALYKAVGDALAEFEQLERAAELDLATCENCPEGREAAPGGFIHCHEGQRPGRPRIHARTWYCANHPARARARMKEDRTDATSTSQSE